MAPIVLALKKEAGFDTRVCVTGQHREMLDQVLDIFDITPDNDLSVMKDGQDLYDVSATILIKLREVITLECPDLILVHGDTATAVTATLAGYFAKIPVGHVEGGLRTGDLYSPWPEEGNRRVISALAALHFAPTIAAANNLRIENVKETQIEVTGNTVIDALMYVVNKIRSSEAMQIEYANYFDFISPERRTIVVTGHRRENFGTGFEQICTALAEISDRFPDVDIIYPMHMNPNVRGPVTRILSDKTNVHLLEPLSYLPFVYLMDHCHLILTDSGGIQEEAPSLGKPVLLMRETTERPEAVDAGTVKLVGTNTTKIVDVTTRLMSNSAAYEKMAFAHNPFGDGMASERIISAIKKWKYF